MIPRRLVDLWIGANAPKDPLEAEPETGLAGAVVVTGGSRGIGLEIARLFAAGGHHVVLVARGAPGLEAAQAELRAQSRSHSVRTVALDITAPDAPEQLSDWLAREGLFSDILVNNAGFGIAGPFHNLDQDRIDGLLRLNIEALTRLTRAMLPDMLRRRRGGVINIGSVAGLVPAGYQAPYYASKAYVVSLSEGLSWEVRGRGVRVCCAAPGPVNTGFHADMDAESAFYRQVPMSLSPARVARAAYRGYWSGRTLVVIGIEFAILNQILRLVPRKIVTASTSILVKPRSRPTDDRRPSNSDGKS
jgi:short-subunit dehydrogenase